MRLKINLLTALWLGLALLLGACGELATPAPTSNIPVVENKVAIGPNNTAQPGVSAIAQIISSPAPVATATQLPQATATSAPTTPATIATTVATEKATTPGTNELPDELLPVQNTPLPDLNQLPRLNGVPKIPLLNSAPRSAQPAPILKSNYGPNNTPRVGLQIGHLDIDQLPDENASLRGQTGGSGGGVREVEFNQNIARRVAALLVAKGVAVDVLPASVPIAYTADVFIAIHADASTSGGPNGFKLARSRFSAIPQTDDKLVSILYETYGKATGLPTDSSITRNMTGYYAFNSRRRQHAISKITPAAIIETGFLTSASDRAVMLNRPDALAQGIADGIWQFLQNRPPLEKREQAQSQVTAIEAKLENTPIYAEGGGAIIAYVSKGQRFENYEDKGLYYSTTVPVLRKPGYIRKSDVVPGFAPR